MIDYGALILNVTDINPDWQQSGIKLPAGRGPTYLHLSRESAETELLRLQGAHPDSEFVLLEMTVHAMQRQNAEPCHGANQKHHTMKPDTHEEPQTAVGSGDLLCDGSGSVCRECSGTGWLVRNLRCGDVERYPCDCPISGRIRIPSNGTRSHSAKDQTP